MKKWLALLLAALLALGTCALAEESQPVEAEIGEDCAIVEDLPAGEVEAGTPVAPEEVEPDALWTEDMEAADDPAEANMLSWTDSDGFSYEVIDGVNNKVCVTGYSGALKVLSIPSKTGEFTVAAIADNAFSGSDITEITLPNTLEEIGDDAFYGAALQKVNLGKGVRTIGDGAFGETKLTSVSLPDSLTKLEDRAFEICESLASVSFGKGISTIERYAFFECTALTSVTIPGNVQTIEDGAFIGCTALKTATLKNGVKTIEDYAFGSCDALEKVILPSSVSKIEDGAFYVYVRGVNFTNPKTRFECSAGSYTAQWVKDNTLSEGASVNLEQSDCYIELANQTYTGKAIKPDPVIVCRNRMLVRDVDYSVTYKNNRKIGKCTATVTAIGPNTGARTLEFLIVPKGTKYTRVTPGKGQLTLKWKKQNRQTTGYQLEIVNNSTELSKTYTVKSPNTTKKVIRKLDRNAYYDIYIRTYKKIGGKYYYSEWSEVEYVTTK